MQIGCFKFINVLFSILLLTSCSTHKVPTTNFYLDKDGNSISKEAFDAKLVTGTSDYALWKYKAKDSSMVLRFSHPEYETYNINYLQFKKSMTNLTGKTYTDNTIFILHYIFKDDYCTNAAPNKWTPQRINNKYRYLSSNLKQVQKKYPQVVFSSHFQKEIMLPELKENQKKMIFQDLSGFLREGLFQNPSLCGSYAIIKPTGEMLIRNGEYGLQGIAKHLEPANWSQFFPEDHKN